MSEPAVTAMPEDATTEPKASLGSFRYCGPDAHQQLARHVAGDEAADVPADRDARDQEGEDQVQHDRRAEARVHDVDPAGPEHRHAPRP